MVGQIRLQRGDTGHDGALVVGGTSTVDLSVPNFGMERRAGPLIEGIDRLHVVVVVQQEGALACTLHAPQHHRRALIRTWSTWWDQLHVKADPLQHVPHHGRHLLKALAMRRDAGLGTDLTNPGQVFVRIAVDGVEDLLHTTLLLHLTTSIPSPGTTSPTTQHPWSASSKSLITLSTCSGGIAASRPPEVSGV